MAPITPNYIKSFFMKLILLLCSLLFVPQVAPTTYQDYQKYMFITAASAGIAYQIYASYTEHQRLSCRTAQEVLADAQAHILKVNTISTKELKYPCVRDCLLGATLNHIYWVNKRVKNQELSFIQAAACLEELNSLYKNIQALTSTPLPQFYKTI